MKNPAFSQRRVGGVCLLLLGMMLPSWARVHRSDAWARAQYLNAEHLREDLTGGPAPERTRHEYQRVISAYRQVYYGAPTSTKADPSVNAVADLLTEEGRQFHDDRILHSAIEQYEFLRREYPASQFRFQALVAIGEIYEDLNDPSHARAAFEEFLKRYPHHHLADEAREALSESGRAATKGDAESQARPQKRAQGSTATDETSAKAGQEEDSPEQASSDRAPSERSPSDLSPSDQAASESASSSVIGKAKEPDSASDDSDDQPEPKLVRVTGIRHWSTPDYTRVAIDLDQEVKFESQRLDHPDRIFFDLPDTKLASRLSGKTFDVDDGFLKKIRTAQYEPGRTRVVLEVGELDAYNAFLLPHPPQLIIDIHSKQGHDAPTSPVKSAKSFPDAASGAAVKPVAGPLLARTERPLAGQESVVSGGIKKTVVEAGDDDDADATAEKAPAASDHSRPLRGRSVREAQPAANGNRSLIRALGLKIGKIVIDPGHGGHDTGTIGPNGLEEKNLVLDVSKRLGKLLETRLGAQVDYTREDDRFIPLETRTAIANQEHADLFVSIHANSSNDPDARGVETYYLNFTSSRDALEVAARENAVSEESIYQLQDLVKKIALKEKIDESREFASDVESALHSGLAVKNPSLRDRGVKKAPFIVLIGANMPSILAEISFVSNPADERKLKTAEYRQRIAESLYRGIARYVNGLSGVKVASKIDKRAGQ